MRSPPWAWFLLTIAAALLVGGSGCRSSPPFLGYEAQPSYTIAARTFKVERIIDGNTFEIEYDGEPTSVRIVGIDAPESRDFRVFRAFSNGDVDMTWVRFGPGVPAGPCDVVDQCGPVPIIPPPCPADVNEDLSVNVLDLIDMLLCFGQPASPPCDTGQDINGDGTINVLDLIDLLLAFGQACP